MELSTNTTDLKVSERVSIALELEQIFKGIKREMAMNFLEMGKVLKKIRDEAYFIELGYNTIGDWYASPEVSLSWNWATGFINIYEVFILKHHFSPEDVIAIDYTKLRDVLTLVKENPEDAEKWFESAKNLRRVDLKREVQEFKVHQEREKFKKNTEVMSAVMEGVEQKFPDNHVFHADVAQNLTKLESERFDCIITTPPILVTSGMAENSSLGGMHQLVSSDESVKGYYDMMVQQFLRILKPKGSVFIFCNTQNLFHVGRALQLQGFQIIRDIIWFQHDAKAGPINRLIPTHSTIIWATKTNKRDYTCNLVDYEKDVWAMYDKNAVIAKLIDMGTYESQLILAPFVSREEERVLLEKLNRRYVCLTEVNTVRGF